MTVGTFLTLVFFGGCAAIFLVLAKTVKTRSDNATFDHDFQRFYGYKNTRIAVSTARAMIKFKAGSRIKAYALSDVRSWEKHWHNYNREGTLTLNVRDIDHPVWTIKFGNETEMNKWYELVSQAVNEKLKL
ncbi:hypothetical protein ABQW67_04325 [Xanthomonas hortorum]|uniref:hypothetical protein n=1 Tax=Xanthomonas hortorum TaxID=56454 RepID=UPI0032E8876A